MKILFDTSVLIPAIVEAHPKHSVALPWLSRARAGKFDFLVSAHSIAECYAVLTTLPVSPKINSAIARKLVRENIEKPAKIISLSASDYCSCISSISEMGLLGGIVYDALIVKSAQKAHVDKLLTFNLRDMRRIWLDAGKIIISPEN